IVLLAREVRSSFPQERRVATTCGKPLCGCSPSISNTDNGGTPRVRSNPPPAFIRQLIPDMFFLLMFVLLVAGLYLPGQWRLTAAGLPLAYASILILTGLGIAKKRGILVGLTFPVAAAIMHFAYAA